MEIETIPTKTKIVFTQDEVRQTRDITTKLNFMVSTLGQMVNGADRTKDEVDEIIKSIVEIKHDVDKYFETFIQEAIRL